MGKYMMDFGGLHMGLDILLFLFLGLFVGTFGTLVGIGGSPL